ncbi:Transposase IS4-like domain-containing protein OS=Streptomyces glaucescens OX=1907 GN=SGLAU_33210 PE=4 SV=1 [Streptomyces glaucescens]
MQPPHPHLRRWLRDRAPPPGSPAAALRHYNDSDAIDGSSNGPLSWLARCRRLHRRYERKPEHFLAITAIATSLINYRRLAD